MRLHGGDTCPARNRTAHRTPAAIALNSRPSGPSEEIRRGWFRRSFTPPCHPRPSRPKRKARRRARGRGPRNIRYANLSGQFAYRQVFSHAAVAMALIPAARELFRHLGSLPLAAFRRSAGNDRGERDRRISTALEVVAVGSVAACRPALRAAVGENAGSSDPCFETISL